MLRKTKTGMLDDKNPEHIPPFWAVMLAGRDTLHMINMIAYVEEYQWQAPLCKLYGLVQTGHTLKLKLPFLTNTRDLDVGELLVLPFDGGIDSIWVDRFPPNMRL